jgi:hypothetical protein
MTMAAAKKRKYLRDAGKRRRRRNRISPGILMLLLLFTVAATLVHVWIRVHVVRQQMQIVSLEKEIESLQDGNEYLRTDLLSLTAVGNLEAAAQTYGFIYPRPDQIVRLPNEIH